ncbi:hypothetical protein MMU07_20355 [Aquiflexum sp. LQ15W]|uniref:hypothetical protein n=1 Tax=Cognataquiflexum nitidum TaxID=2922272 RepID=UPI001F136E86|nr:hypothetical protein [Cognataquiflexum nitidum]MCH6201942.1 hypothetical protein [Cognataquiflexum nitidum]
MIFRGKLLFYALRFLPKRWGFVIAAIFMFSSCSFTETKNPMLGNWYGFEMDSTYYELYVNDSLIVLHHHQIGPIGYDYHVEGNLLVVSNEAGMERIWQVSEGNYDTFTLTDSLESIRYKRLDLPKDFFLSIKDSLSYSEFKKEFLNRYSKKNKSK